MSITFESTTPRMSQLVENMGRSAGVFQVFAPGQKLADLQCAAGCVPVRNFVQIYCVPKCKDEAVKTQKGCNLC